VFSLPKLLRHLCILISITTFASAYQNLLFVTLPRQCNSCSIPNKKGAQTNIYSRTRGVATLATVLSSSTKVLVTTVDWRALSPAASFRRQVLNFQSKQNADSQRSLFGSKSVFAGISMGATWRLCASMPRNKGRNTHFSCRETRL
jgi:hypothetical protein